MRVHPTIEDSNPAAAAASAATAAEKTADVVVVGGGPAGLAAAEAAGRGGARTVLFERNKEIGYPVHTSGGSWVADMVALGIPAHLYNPIRRVTFMSPGNSCDFDYPEPACCVIDVRASYQFLAKRAIEGGAIIHVASPVEGPVMDGGRVAGVRAKTPLGEEVIWRAPLTIDCSGFSSVITTRSQIHPAYQRYGYGAEWDLVAPAYPTDRVYLIMGSAVAPSGYAWAFPYGDGRVRVGVGVVRPDVDADARRYLFAIGERIPELGNSLEGASAVEYHVGLLPSEGLRSHLVADGLLTAGDAAGQASTLVGEGIRFSLYAGQMAGEAGAQAVLRGDTSARALAGYERAWKKRFGRSLKLSLMINHRLTSFTDARWDRGVEILKTLSPKQAAQLIRGDFSGGLVVTLLGRLARA
jgi:digeranylgeranylglycerophospholipid reductase